MKVSNCCGAVPRSNGDCDSMDLGICPECKEHCEYVEEGEGNTSIGIAQEFTVEQHEIIERLKVSEE